MRNMYRTITGGDPSCFVALKLRVRTKILIEGLVPRQVRLELLPEAISACPRDKTAKTTVKPEEDQT